MKEGLIVSIVIDAKGLDCPKPVIKTKQAVDSGCGNLSVLVDNEVAASNVTRFLEGQGYVVTRADKEGTIELFAVLTKAADTKVMDNDSAFSVLITADRLGAPSNGLGEVLMKAYIGTLVQREVHPVSIALMNEAVKMTLTDSSALDSLLALSAKGTKVLVCGTCAKHFGITDDVKVGIISNMFEITESVFFSAPKYIVIG